MSLSPTASPARPERAVGSRERSRPSIVGIGAVTAYGWGEKCVRDGLFSAHSALRPVPAVVLGSTRDTPWMAPVSDDGDPSGGPDRLVRAARFAGREAFADASERGWRPSERIGVVHAVDAESAGAGSAVVRDVSRELALGGPSLTVAGGSTTALDAMAIAGLWVASGMADDVLVLASDLSASSEHPGKAGAGAAAGASPGSAPWSQAVCRPFQDGSTGPNAGEASVALLLSCRADAAYGVLTGWAMARAPATDASGGTAPFPGRRLDETVRSALAAAGVEPVSVAYLNADGSGDPQYDAVESEMLDRVPPAAVGVYSIKPLVGDCGVASGLVELLAALYGFATGVVPAPPRASKGHDRLLDGPTAAVEGPVVKTSLDADGGVAALVLCPAS